MKTIYGHKIQHNDKGWFFELYPSNSWTQPMGYSEFFTSREECLNVLNEYPIHFFTNNIKSEKSEYVELERNSIGQYRVQYYNKDKKKIFHSRSYEQKKSCKNVMDRFYALRNEFAKICLGD